MKQIITFYLDDCLFGLENTHVDAVLPPTSTAAVPQRQEQLFKGTMQLQDGRVIHVINTPKLLGMEHRPQNEATKVIVLRAKNLLLGLIVDQISEVTNVAEEEITRQMPLSQIDDAYLAGVITSRSGKVIVLLDTGAMLSVLNP